MHEVLTNENEKNAQAGRTREGRLTVGVIARNGFPHLPACLASLPPLRGLRDIVEFVLVDSVSSDGTGAAMAAFAREHPPARVFRIDGDANAAVARNVILEAARPGDILLLDGDIVVNEDFVREALSRIDADDAEAVAGRLEEVWHDEAHCKVGGVEDKYDVHEDRLVRWSGGVILVSAAVLASGLRFDERLRRNEDRDFSFRLSERYRLRQIPVSMGVHLTQRYVSSARVGRFYREAYVRPLGFLLRKHWYQPHLLRVLLVREKGLFLGLALQGAFLVGLVAGWMPLWGGAALLALLDFLKFCWQRRPHEFLPLRVIGPWMLLWGLFGPGEAPPRYSFHEVETGR